MNKFLTPECYHTLLLEIDQIKNEQVPAIAEEIAIARSHGDLRENAQYASAREKQRMIESRLHELESVVSSHTVVNISEKIFERVTFGCRVEIEFEDDNATKSFQILSDYDSDISKGIISINSPIARSILDLSLNDVAEVTLNGKTRDIVIRKVG